jgi:hypothetical protein
MVWIEVAPNTSTSGWPERTLQTVAERIFVGLADARQRGDGDRCELPLLNVRDLHEGHVPSAAALTKRPVPARADVGRYTVRADDIVVTCRGTQLKIANITPLSEGALISANLIAIRTGSELLPGVLWAFLRSPLGQKALLERGQSSSSNILLTPRAVGELAIPVPPMAVQRQIAELVSAAEHNYVAAVRAAEQRRAVAHAVAANLLRRKPRPGKRS